MMLFSRGIYLKYNSFMLFVYGPSARHSKRPYTSLGHILSTTYPFVLRPKGKKTEITNEHIWQKKLIKTKISIAL